MKRGLALLLIISLFLIQGVSAATLNDSIINLTSANTTINVTYPWTFDNLTVGDSWYNVINQSDSNPASVTTDTLTYNFSEYNTTYSGTDSPYYSSSSTVTGITTIGISMGYADDLVIETAVVTLASCPLTLTYSSASGTYTSITDSCTGGVLTLSNFTLESGTGTLTADYNEYPGEFYCTGFVSGLTIFGTFAALLILSMIGIFIYRIFRGEHGENDINGLTAAAVALLILAIATLTMIVIVRGICGVI